MALPAGFVIIEDNREPTASFIGSREESTLVMRWHRGRNALVGGESGRDCEFPEAIAKSCAVRSSYSQGTKYDAPEFDRRFRTFLTLRFVLSQLRRQIVR
jgi:hypothetical protein